MLTASLATIFVLCTGTLAGALVAVEHAIVPMLSRLPRHTWSVVHRSLDPGFDPLMPTVNKIGLASGLALVFLAPGGGSRAAFGCALAALVTVALVSELCNVRMNRRIDAWAADGAFPEDWRALRARWAHANRRRTAAAVLAFGGALCGCWLGWV